jgi:hypothetical protein
VIAPFILTPGHVNEDSTSFFWSEALFIVSSNFGRFGAQIQSTLTNTCRCARLASNHGCFREVLRLPLLADRGQKKRHPFSKSQVKLDVASTMLPL